MSYKPSHSYSQSCPTYLSKLAQMGNQQFHSFEDGSSTLANYADENSYPKHYADQNSHFSNEESSLGLPNAPSVEQIREKNQEEEKYRDRAAQNQNIQPYTLSNTCSPNPPRSVKLAFSNQPKLDQNRDALQTLANIPEKENYEKVIESLSFQFQKLSLDISSEYNGKSTKIMKQLELAQEFQRKKQKVLKKHFKEELKLQNYTLQYQKKVLENVHKLRELNRTFMQHHLKLEEKYAKES